MLKCVPLYAKIKKYIRVGNGIVASMEGPKKKKVKAD